MQKSEPKREMDMPGETSTFGNQPITAVLNEEKEITLSIAYMRAVFHFFGHLGLS